MSFLMQTPSAEAVFPLSSPYFSEREGIYAGATFAMRTNSYFSKQEAICAEHPLSPRSLVFPEAGSKHCTVTPLSRGWKQFIHGYSFFSRELEAMYTTASYAQ